MEEEIKETNDDIEKDSETEGIENNNSEEGCVEENNNAEEDEVAVLKKRIEELENESADMKDKYMRAMAEVENVRKRTSM